MILNLILDSVDYIEYTCLKAGMFIMLQVNYWHHVLQCYAFYPACTETMSVNMETDFNSPSHNASQHEPRLHYNYSSY